MSGTIRILSQRHRYKNDYYSIKKKYVRIRESTFLKNSVVAVFCWLEMTQGDDTTEKKTP